MAALSQLSYGPLFVAQSSGEIKIVGPMYAEFLVVVRAAQAKMNLCATHELLVWQEEATVDLFAVGRVRIDLAFGVDSCHAGRRLSPKQTTP
jgi:hypothetical protein